MTNRPDEEAEALEGADQLPIEDTERNDVAAYVTYEIASYPADYTLSVLQQMWDQEDIVVPTFQRKFVWSIEQSSLLIESLLMGLPVPQAFFFVEPDSKNLVIDGLQRIMSIVYFFSGFFGDESFQGKKTVFRLTGLNEKSPFSGKRFEDLSDSEKRKLKNSVLRVINVRQLGPKNDDTSAYHIFERLNTGGTPLRAQEIRHCVFHGDLVNTLSALNEDENWRKVLGKRAFDKHQRDTELILRVLAFATRADEYEKPMKEFLNKTMSHYKKGDAEEVANFTKLFPKICADMVGQVGERPFNPRGRVNASALDSVMGMLIRAGGVPSDFKERYKALFQDADFIDTLSVSTSDAAVVRKRLEAVNRHLS